MPREIYERNPIRVLMEHLERPVGPGELGAIVARAGVGKSAMLVHVALEALLRDVGVLHVSLRDSVDHVRSFYDEIFSAAARAGRVRDRAGAMVAAERHRMIHSYRDKSFSLEQLRANLSMLAEVAQFTPGLIVIDGLDSSAAAELVAELALLAGDLQVPVWMTVRTGADGSVDDSVIAATAITLRLSPDGRTVKLTEVSSAGSRAIPVSLEPSTMLVIGDDTDYADSSVLSPRAGDCTLYSGGANGAEAAFGEACELWGVHEVNFTFDGHKQSRTRGRYALSPRELAAGDVSLVYVSRRLNRTYSEGSLIRKVLQTLWHMVSRSQQVFVIGQIQEDGTVVGGTGWSVELARMWNKSLWVYDQDRKGWFRWDGSEWVVGTPVIESIHFTGTGTRYLTDEGQAAVRELFERSFAPRADSE